MVIFKFVFVSILGLCLPSQTFSQQDEQLWPSNYVGTIQQGLGRFLLHSPSPLQNCIFTLPTGSTFDFSLGHNSTQIAEYQGYYGFGLERGDCGFDFEITNTSFEGVITCLARKVGSNNWIKSASTLRIAEKALPSFEIGPRWASLEIGDYLNITCNAKKRPLEVCRFIMPDGSEINFDKGPKSKRSDEYRYLGAGVPEGKCGITLRVDMKHNGQIFCKIGKEPLTAEGRWHMGVMLIETKERREATAVDSGVENEHTGIKKRATTTTRPTTSRPGAVQPGTDCGRNHVSQVGPQISGGTDALIGEFPWHAGVYRLADGTFIQQCGGTLISTNIVITAAHCFVSEASLTVGDKNLYRIGLGKHLREWNEADDPAEKRVQRFRIKQIIAEPRYKGRKENFQFDIAVVVLNKNARITDYVDIICMDWDSSSKSLQLADGQVGVATGWGATDKETSSRELQVVKLPWVSDVDCLSAINGEAQAKNSYYTSDKFCAGHRFKNTSVCKGDSGGGLFFLNKSTKSYFLRGVTSVSFEISKVRGQCANQLYTGFTDVGTYIRDLIEPVVFRESG